MATRYENKVATFTVGEGAEMFNGTADQAFTNWAKNMLVEWHNQDPVSAREIARNDSIYKIQFNRNPFIDHPELVNKIWGSDNIPFGDEASASQYSIKYILKKDDNIIEQKILTMPTE
jgi:hypothetical protein